MPSGLKMGDLRMNLNEPPKQDGYKQYVVLAKDQKLICRTQCVNPPCEMPPDWNIFDLVRKTRIHFLSGLPQFFLHPACQNSRDQKEWEIFLNFLQRNDKVAIVKLGLYEFYILPPGEGSNFSHVVVAYRMEKADNACDGPKHDISVADESRIEDFVCSKDLLQPTVSTNTCMNGKLTSSMKEAALPSFQMIEEFTDRSDAYMREAGSPTCADKCSPNRKFPQASVDHHVRKSRVETCSRSQPSSMQDGLLEKNYVRADPTGSPTCADKCSPNRKFPQASVDHHVRKSRVETCSRSQPSSMQDGLLEKNYVRADPSYLKTLGQAHSGWIFGAIAELIDNSRDAKATKLDILIEIIYLKKAGKHIPMLSVMDDGPGMTHQEILRMISFGHKQPDGDDPDHIGRFGIGFKTGAMRLGKDALVLTQTAHSRSIAFLSQSLNEGKDNLEIPIVCYCRRGQFMEVDTSVQSEDLAKFNLKAIKEFSPFDKYLIGEKAGLFHEKGTGTQIYIWNLDEWGTDYCLEWQTGLSGGSSFHQGDIFIRSRRIRSRPGQISQKVPLDYSLQAYLEVIFLDPRMKIYVQGSLVKSRPLAKSLNMTVVEDGYVMGKHVQLTIGRCQLEWEQANCGIFLYWHGRLIEAFKRVGGMIHNADMGRGVIGVLDVTGLMNGGNGQVWVHSNKQGFQDCEPYARLEEWLGNKADEYWDMNFDTLQLKKGNALYKPDHEWVQCDKCRKWRMLSSSFDSRNLPQEWFCYMKPFNGSCGTPEQKHERGVITVSAKRSGYDPKQMPTQCKEVHLVNITSTSGGNSGDDSDQTVEEDVRPPVLKRLRRGLPRACKMT